jgi:ABC-type glycerol-3-phosphate transport system substrate-binding protein
MSSSSRQPAFLSRRTALKGAAAAGGVLAARSFPGRATAAPARQDAVALTWLTDLPNGPELVAAFSAENPDIQITVEEVAFRDLFQQNQVRLGAGQESPDIISVDAPVNSSYGLRGWLLPLDQYFTPEQTAAWVPAQKDSSTYEGKLLSAPVWNSSQVLYYNLDLFTAAGITPPGETERWTWDQVGEAARALTAEGRFGFQFEQYNRIYQLQPLPQGKGVPVIGEDGLTVKGIVDAPEWVDAFTWFSQLHKDKVAPGGEIAVGELFRAQQLAMTIRGPWGIQEFIETPLDFQWRVAPHPYWGGEIHVPTDSWHLGINAKSKYPEQSARFLQWVSSTAGAKVWRDLTPIWPCQTELLTAIIDDPANAEWPNRAYSIAAGESAHATIRPLTVGYLEYEELLSDAFEDIRNGSDVQESLSGAASRIDREMQKYRR